MPRLSVAIIARNESVRLPACLASIQGLADEIVMVDTMSTDDTPVLARRAGARVEQHPFDGFGRTKQRAIEMATGDWVLSLDADERVTPELAAAIKQAIASADAAEGYQLRWNPIFLGRALRFGSVSKEWVTKLVRRGRGRFTEEPIHEHLQIDGRIGRLTGLLDHDTCRSLADYGRKLEWYAALRAAELKARGERYHWWDSLRLPGNFVLNALLRLGFLDGVPGLIYAAGSAYHSWRKRDLLRERPAAGPGVPVQ